jgi:hypothetical protein
VAIAASICEMGVGVRTSTISQSRRAFNPILGDQQNPLQPETIELRAKKLTNSDPFRESTDQQGSILPSAERLTLGKSDHDLPKCDENDRVSRRLARQTV